MRLSQDSFFSFLFTDYFNIYSIFIVFQSNVLMFKSTYSLFITFLLLPFLMLGQHDVKLNVKVNWKTKTLNVKQELIFKNNTNDILETITLNDWNNAYSSNSTPLGKRFSDEFYRGFHLSSKEEKGATLYLKIKESNQDEVTWYRLFQHPDVIEILLNKPLYPNQSVSLSLSYDIKLPSNRFTGVGYSAKKMNLKDWCITPARYENQCFVQYSNENLEDIANAMTNYDIEFTLPTNIYCTSDLDELQTLDNSNTKTIKLKGEKRTKFSIYLEEQNTFSNFSLHDIEIVTNLKDYDISPFQKAIIIERVKDFTQNHIGNYPFKKLVISQEDYSHYPFYGLNQLPSILNPFDKQFVFELQLLKTYLNNFLKTSIHLNPRNDNWIYDAFQIFSMMQYIDQYYPNQKMFGNISKIKLLRSYNLVNLKFNEQYSYFYMLMARKNLDQPLGNPKNTLLKFNEQIANKYSAGLSLHYLNSYLKNDIVPKTIFDFYSNSTHKDVNRKDFETLLQTNSKSNLNWFFNTMIDSRTFLDFKLKNVTKTNDSLSFSVKSKTGTPVPVPIYGIKKNEVVFSKWIDTNQKPDSIYTIPKMEAEKVIINYKNEVPEFNLRNNWKKIEGFFPNNRPIKFVFLKDLEDSFYNQIIYNPVLGFNIYDGLAPGIRFHNKTVLNKPFVFDVSPMYSIKAKNFSGSGYIAFLQNNRDSRWFTMRYSFGASYFRYAPDATYLRLNPMIQMQIRNEDFRDNRKQLFVFRNLLVQREKSEIVNDPTLLNYSVFNARYSNSKTEISNHLSLITDVQLSKSFGKASLEMEYRRLFNDNRQLNVRLYFGHFLYNKTRDSDFFSFALDRPTDYLFDYNYYARSDESGFFSQQFVLAEGGFKSKLPTPFANQWISTCNISYALWNWVEVYGDVGFLKDSSTNPKFVYDSGIRLNLLTEYFELFFPIHSSEGWEINSKNYHEKIRFIITIDPTRLVNLFTRKWF